MSEARERMRRGELYRADDPTLVAERRGCRLLVERFNATSVDDEGLRQELLSELLGGLGRDSAIEPPLQLDYGLPTSVGERTFINYGAVILDCAPVAIGDEVQIATNVQLLTAAHPLEAAPRRDRWEYALPITIEDGAWLGGGAIVCPGVTVGENTVVGAGAVVTESLPPGVLAVGVPARVVRELP